MPMFSIIVPIHGVEEWVDECVGSILSQSFTDFELIAVDDCSPDNSIDILRSHAERDARLRIVSLERNVGSGLARNAGLDLATGEYVWLIDGDDWIEPGSLQAIADRVRATDADVVTFGWERQYANGRRTRGGHQHVYKSAPDTFALEQYPQLTLVVHFVWNKVVRRDLIERHGYRFEAGQYQDLDFTYFMLSAAEKIAVLDRVCLAYRQRDTNVTKTASDKHFAVFDHWERTYSLLDQHGLSSPKVNSYLFARMIRHFNYIVNHPSRIPDASRRRFVATASAFYRRYRPDHLLRPPTILGRLRHALIALGAYPMIEAGRRIRQLRRSLRQKPVAS